MRRCLRRHWCRRRQASAQASGEPSSPKPSEAEWALLECMTQTERDSLCLCVCGCYKQQCGMLLRRSWESHTRHTPPASKRKAKLLSELRLT